MHTAYWERVGWWRRYVSILASDILSGCTHPTRLCSVPYVGLLDEEWGHADPKHATCSCTMHHDVNKFFFFFVFCFFCFCVFLFSLFAKVCYLETMQSFNLLQRNAVKTVVTVICLQWPTILHWLPKETRMVWKLKININKLNSYFYAYWSL
jgi:hypothetical protein